MTIPFTRVRNGAQTPTQASSGSAGFDLCACVEEAVTIPPMGRAMIPTGLAMALPSADVVGLVYARSGLATRSGIALANGVGVIDSDYRGELCVALINLSDAPYTVQDGDRIAQLVITPIALPEWVEAETLDDTARGAGGFGSSGV